MASKQKKNTAPKKKARPASKAGPTTIDAFLATVSPDKRAALQKLRAQIRAAAPRAVECISYQLPCFKVDGKGLMWFGAGKHHCALYPGAIVQAHAAELAGYETSKGAIRFTPEKPLPAALVKKLVKYKLAMLAALRG